MTGQSARAYRERKGLDVTRRRTGRSVLAPGDNIVLSTPAIVLPEHQLVERVSGSPDVAGTSVIWPSEERSSHA